MTYVSKITEYAVAADARGDVHVIYRNQPSGPNEIAYLRWDGQTWSAPEVIAAGREYLGEIALAVEDSGRVHAAWIKVPPYRRELHYRCRDESGWSAEQTLNPARPTASSPAIGADGEGRIHVIWEDTRQARRDLYALHCLEGQWSAEERLTRLPTVPSSLEASLAVDARGNAHLAWSDNRNDYHGVYYRRWSPAAGWSRHERVTIVPSDAKSPSLAVDGSGHAHLVWCDNRDGNREIYYLQRPPDEPWGPDGPGPASRPSVRCVPNPFRSATAIRAYVPTAGSWAVRIYDVQGRLAWSCPLSAAGAGEHALDWSGRTDDGQALAHGLYFVRVSGCGRSAATRVVLTRP